MPPNSLTNTAIYSSNVLVEAISTTTSKVLQNLEITSNLIEKEVSKLQGKINFSKGAKIVQFEQPTIIDNGVVVQPTLIDEKYVYVFNSVGSNNSIRFPQNAKASVLVVGGGGAGAPNIGGGGSGGSVIIGEDLEIIGNETFPIIVGKGGSGSNVQDGEDSYAFGAIAKGGKAGTTLVINQDGSTIGGEGGNLVESYSINTDIVFKENKYRAGLKNSNRKSAVALDLGYSFYNDTNNMVAWYKFDDLTNPGLSSVNSSTYNLTYNGTSPASQYAFSTTDYKRGTSSLTRVSQEISLGNTLSSPSLPRIFTISIWIKVLSSSQSGYNESYISTRTTSPTGFLFYKDSSYFMRVHLNYAGNVFGSFPYNADISWNNPSYIANDWNHVVITFDSITTKQLKIYLNNTEVLNKTESNMSLDYSVVFNSTLFYIAMDKHTNSYYLNNGIFLDDLRIYNRLLTEDERNILYTGQESSTTVDPDLFINLKFDGNLTDSSGNGYDLLLMAGQNIFEQNALPTNGYAINLTNTTTFYKFSKDLNFTGFTELSVTFWLKKTGLNTLFDTVIHDNDNASIQNQFRILRNVSNSSWVVVAFGSIIYLTGYMEDWIASDFNIWHHYSFIFNKTNTNNIRLQIYKDGSSTYDQIISNSSWTTGAIPKLQIGKNASDTNGICALKGYLGDIRFYKRAITAAEVTKVYNGQSLVTTTTITTNTTTNTISYTYFAGGGSGAGSEAVEAEINVYPDGGSGVTNSYIIKNEFGKGGGGGSSSSYGYGGGRGTGQNANINQTDALSGTGNGGGGGKKGSAIGGSGGSGFVAVIWDKTDTVQLSDEDELNMSNYISTMKSNINDSLTSLSNYIVNELETSSNHISNLDYIVDNHPNLFSDKMLHGSSNKFITKNTWNDSLVIDGILYTSNTRIVGSNITQYVEAFETSDLSIVSTAEDLDAVTISHSGIGSNNLLSTYVANTPALIITSEGNIGIGTTTPSSKIEVVGNINISGNILPTSNEVYDIGSSNIKIRDLYLSQATIHMGTNTKISASLEDGGQFTVKDNTGNLKGVTASSFKLRDENVSTVKSFAMKVKTVGTGLGLSKKLTFVAEDIQTAEEEQVETASQHWKINSSNNQIQHNNIAIDETSNYISFGTNTRIDNESIKFNTDISNDNLLTEEEDFTVITFTGKDSVENEVTNNSFDISNVMFKPSGRTDGKFHRTFDISITSQENILLYSITIIRSYLYNAVTQQKDPCDISKDIVFSYYSLNTIQNSTNHPNDGFVLNNNEIWFEIINGIEYLKASVQNNNYIKVTSI